jgi:hypothetical protein
MARLDGDLHGENRGEVSGNGRESAAAGGAVKAAAQ